MKQTLTRLGSLCALLGGAANAALPGLQLDGQLRQGALVSGRSEHLVEVDGRLLRRGPSGEIVFGLGRDQQDVDVCIDDGRSGKRCERMAVQARSWRTERVSGLPPSTVQPDPATAARIASEARLVAQARTRNDARVDFLGPWQAPASGRISGVYGSQRIRNGVPGSPHFGHDIAAPTGTPVLAAATGVVSLVGSDMVLPGNTVLLDHGHGVSTVYIHLSRIDVAEGQRVQAGEVIGAIGATGRASGPHLHWGLNWFDVKLDPAPLLGD
jgi:murein DD-endopeptidase MepM/ murein hydrolase activator NlpD